MKLVKYQKKSTLSKAKSGEVKKQDKLQNKVLTTLQKKVKQLEKAPELKYLYSYLPWNQTDGQTTTGPALLGNMYYNGYIFDTCLNLSQGLDYQQRIGDVINIKYTSLKYTIGFPQPIIDNSGNLTVPYAGYTGAVRVCLVQDMDIINQNNTSQQIVPTINDIFNTEGYGNLGTLTGLNPDLRGRFKLLYSKIHILDGINKFIVHGGVNLRHNIKTTYNNPSNNVYSAGKNHIYMIAYTDSVYAEAGVGMPQMSYNVTHRFVDC